MARPWAVNNLSAMFLPQDGPNKGELRNSFLFVMSEHQDSTKLELRILGSCVCFPYTDVNARLLTLANFVCFPYAHANTKVPVSYASLMLMLTRDCLL
jgi:hypothetical protein